MPDLHETINQFLEGSIASIGRDPVIESKSITANGTYTAPEGVDGYSPITVNVPTPTPVIESKSITANGTYTAPEGVDGYSPITVNVPTPTPVIESKSITANGTYTAPEGVDGYNPITVNVPLPQNAYLLKSVANLPQAIASFNDGQDMVMPTLKVAIEPQQEGSGDPSPTNIRPISGWSAVDVTKSGKNWLPATIEGIKATNTSGSWSGNVYTLNGVAFTIQTDTDENITGIMLNGTSTAVTYFYINSSFTIKAGVYVLNGAPQSSGIENWRLQVNTSELYIDTGGGANLTVSEDYSGATSFIRVGTNRTLSNVLFNPMIRLASETDATFEPYNPNSKTITIQLGDTYYGGTLDVVSGVLTVDRAYVDLGSMYWNYSASDLRFYNTALANAKAVPNVLDVMNGLCDHYKTVAYRYINATSEEDGIIGMLTSGTTNYLAVKDTRYTSSSDFTNAVSGTKLVYELATPLTIQLTPTAIKSLRGVNNVYANTGDITDAEYFSKEE